METRQKWPVVLVDDEEDILFGAEYLLNTHGITTVTTLGDGREHLSGRLRQGSESRLLQEFRLRVLVARDTIGNLIRPAFVQPVMILPAS